MASPAGMRLLRRCRARRPLVARVPKAGASHRTHGRWRAAAAALLAAAALALVAGATPPAAAQPRPQAAVVRIPFPQDDGSLTPYTFELAYPLLTLVYDTLLWRDAAGVPQPWLARSVTPAADGRQLTVRLAEGARWHDGRPVTADDVAFTFRYVAGRPHPRFTAQLRDVERVDVFDPATLVISLRRPSPGFTDQPLADLPILPAHLWAGLPADRATPDGLPVGSGPYRLTRYDPGRGWGFEAVADYFKGRPAVGALDVSVVRDSDGTLEAFKRRRADMVAVSLPWAAQSEVAGLGTAIARGPSYLGTVLLFNLRAAPFDRPEARRAVAGLLRRDRLARTVGGAVPASRGFLHPASPWAPAEGAVEPVRAGPGAPPSERVTVLAPDNDPVKGEAGRQVVLALERGGMDAELVRVGSGELADAVGEDGSPPTFQAAIWSSPALASYDPVVLARLFGSDPRDAATNLTGYRSAAFDAAADRIATTVDRGARRAAVDEALRTLEADVPAVPLFFADGAFAFRPSVYDGWVFTKGSGILDKRSFVEPKRAASGAASPSPAVVDDGGSSFGFGWAALVAAAAAGVLALRLLVGRLRRRDGPPPG